MVAIAITHPDGSTETIPETAGWTRKREIGKMRRVTIDVPRDDAQAVSLQPKQDTISLGDIDTLRLVDVETGGSTWRLVCYSFEWDANKMEFTAGGDLREGTDQTLITNLIGEVDSWTAGNIETHTGVLSFVLNHAHRHEALRRIERNVPGEIQFRDSGTVDYVENLGTDKTASVTLSSAAGNLEGEIRITNRGRELDGTHIRVLGAHEGEAQLFANLVPDDDPATYENRVDYTTGRWSSGDDADWDRWQNKDVSDQATILEEASALGEEITEDLVEAKATVAGEDLRVGDWVHVEKPDSDLDRDMRVHRIKTVTVGAKTVDDVLLSTRTVMRQEDGRDLRDIQRYNTAFQGSSVILQGGGSRQPVTSGVNAEIPFRYPAINFEHTAELFVRGLPYRAYSKGAASSGGQHSHSVTIPDHDHSVTYEALDHNHDLMDQGQDMDYGSTSSETADGSGHSHTYKVGYSIFNAESTTTTSASGGGTTQTSSDTTPSHTHDPDPGVIEFGTETPTGVDVLIGGTTVATDIGSGTFETTIDITGELQQGGWNMIELVSDTLGHVQATVFIRAYDQIGVNQ